MPDYGERDDRDSDVSDTDPASGITQHESSERAYRTSIDRARMFLQTIPDRVLWIDENGEWRWFSDILDPLTGAEAKLKPDEMVSLEDIPLGARESIERALIEARRTGTMQKLEFELREDDAWRVYETQVLNFERQGAVCIIRDVSDLRSTERELVRLTRSLEKQANHDHLTGLPNRRGLEKALFMELERARRLGTRVCAVLIDCDNFKRINDSLGHATGDVVLQEIGNRLMGVVRPTDHIGRVGGDEFLVIFPDTRESEAMRLAERLRLAVTDSPLTTAAEIIGITASLGVSLVPSDAVSVEEIISYTQHALSNSKKLGKNRVSGQQESPPQSADDFERLLRVLEVGKGFRTVAQPILDMSTGRIDAYELLTRGPVGLLENPEDIFRLSSENNILTVVDLHCVKRNVNWAKQRLNGVRFHLNLFPSTLLDTPAARLVAAFGDEKLLSSFCVEISEQQFIGDPNYLKPGVRELRRAGATIALDDVGFGRSSLEALILLEPDSVKLDKSVVHGVAQDRAQRRTLDRLIRVIEGLEAQPMAEGVEKPEDRDVLLDMGVTHGQGFLFGRPAPNL